MAKEKALMEWEEGAAERYRMMLFSDGEEVFMDNTELEKVGSYLEPRENQGRVSCAKLSGKKKKPDFIRYVSSRKM